MKKPTECKWCGCGSVYSVSDRHVKFTCRSAWTADGDCWACSSQCCDGMRDRIRRAVEVLEKGERFVDYTVSGEALEILRGNSSANDRGLASRLLPDLAMILMGSRVGKTKCMPWLNLCRELGLTLKDLTDEIKRQGETDGKAE